MDMGERVALLREALNNINQEDFGTRIGVSKFSISSYENGKRKLTDRNINDICREFNVNESWLRYGIGEMFVVSTNNILYEIEQKFEMGDIFKQAVISYLELNELNRKIIDDYLESIVKKVNNK